MVSYHFITQPLYIVISYFEYFYLFKDTNNEIFDGKVVFLTW